MADDIQTEQLTPPAGDADPAGMTAPGELHLDLGVTRPVAPVPVNTGEDKIKSDFLAGRALAQRGNPAEEFNAILGRVPGAATKAAPGAAEGAAAAPAAQAGAGGQSKLLSAVGAPYAALIGPDSDSPPGQKLLSIPMAIGKDVATGTFDAPRQVIGGALDFGNNLMRFADDVVKKAEDAGMPNVYFELMDKDGNWNPSMMSTEDFRKAQAEGRDDVFQLPTTGGPDTVTGNIIRTGTTFMLGRGTGGGLVGGMGGLVGEATKDFVSGVVGQNPNQPRLSNLVDQVAPNFVTDFLKAKNPGEEDALISRLKSGLEYAGLGVAIEGIKKVIKGVKAGIKDSGVDISQLGEGRAPGTPGLQPSLSGAKGTATEPARDILQLGNPLSPAFDIPMNAETSAMAQRFLAGDAGSNPVKLNLARIGSSDDIKQVLADISKTIPAESVQSNEATVMLADALGKTPQDYLRSNIQGSALNAQEAVAARMMLDSSAGQLIDYAKAASDPLTATPEAKAIFLRAFATHRAIQQYVEGARTEAGRALQSWSIMSSQRSNFSKAISDMVENVDRGGDLTTMAQRLADVGDAVRAGRMVDQAFQGTARDGFLKVFYNVLLSNPKTVIKKLASDVGQSMWNLASTYAAEKFGSGAVPPGETSALAWGYINSLKDSIRFAGKSLQAGESRFYSEYQSMDALGKGRLSMLANGAPEMFGNEDAPKTAIDYLKSAMPTSWIGAADDFAKFWNYRAEVGRLAYRDAAGQGLVPGTEEFATQLAQTLDNIPQSIHQEAITNTLKTTFQEPLTGLAQILKDGADKINIPIAHTDFQLPLGRILLPFVKIPANIARWSYYNSPLAAVFPNSNIKAELASGGATADLAKARIALGSMVALGLADLALNNVMTGRGPSDPQLQGAWQRAGNQPYSLQLANLGGPFKNMPPIGYNQIEPFGLMASAVADSFGIMKFAKDDGRDNIAASLVFGVGNAMLSKTYMQGVANFFEAMNSPERDGQRWADNLISSLTIPQGVKAVTHGLDEWKRAHYGLIDSLESNLPMVSKGLPPARTLWGDPVPMRDAYLPFITEAGEAIGGKTQQVTEGLARAISPVPLGQKLPVQPIDKWIWDNRLEFPRGSSNYLGISPPSQVQSFNAPGGKISAQIQLEPDELDRLKVLAGNEMKDPQTGLGAKDYLNSLVQGTHPSAAMQREWNGSSTALKALIVQRTINTFRDAAKKQLPQEFPELGSALMAGWQMRAQQLQPAPAQGLPHVAQ